MFPGDARVTIVRVLGSREVRTVGRAGIGGRIARGAVRAEGVTDSIKLILAVMFDAFGIASVPIAAYARRPVAAVGCGQLEKNREIVGVLITEINSGPC